MLNKVITIYVGNNCHLCEIAKDLIIEALKATDWKYNEVNISNNVLLREKYGLRIPVAVNPVMLPSPFTTTGMFYSFGYLSLTALIVAVISDGKTPA